MKISESDATNELNSKNRKLLEKLMRKPAPVDIRWDEVARLVEALGGRVVEKSGKTTGSAAFFVVNGRKAHFHKPHPDPELKRYALKQLVDFFKDAGVIEDETS